MPKPVITCNYCGHDIKQQKESEHAPGCRNPVLPHNVSKSSGFTLHSPRPKIKKEKLDISSKPALQRFGTLLTLSYITGCTSTSETAWLQNLIEQNWETKPHANDATYCD
jgi:hypothetical protein